MKPRVLITGGSGFLGRHLALAMRADWDVILAARNQKQRFHAEQVTGAPTLPLDVTSIESVRDAVTDATPDVIIHAAATKFVDLAEQQPMECVDVNVTGSQNVARVAIERGVGTVLGISTDKATPPVRNTYGLSKALMERMFCSLDSKSSTRFACVRYGNVAWSTGSVLPVWKRMHDETGVIGSTGPHMRRFFFPVEEAVALVQTALEQIDEIHGRVLSRSMKAARIEDLLNTWVGERGGRWEQIAGRPGERDDEYLVGEIELPFTTAVAYGDVPHYLISFNDKVEDPLPESLSSANAPRLTHPEMLAILEAARD